MIKDIQTFGIIGGDKRQLFLAKSISERGYNVLLGGFDKLVSLGDLKLCSVKQAIFKSDVLIFPLPSVRADSTLNTPFSNYSHTLDDGDLYEIAQKPVFAAMRDKLFKAYPSLKGASVYDYSSKDEFAILNALPTAEGAVECAMQNFEGTISGSRCMITGFGRIGKILAKLLQNMQSEVTVTARSSRDLAYADALGYRVINTQRLRGAKGYDIIFNTIPSMIFDREMLLNVDRDTLIIDLASLPGGVDFEAAHELGIDAVRALSLPGKCAPKTAGKIIETTVFNIIEEVYR